MRKTQVALRVCAGTAVVMIGLVLGACGGGATAGFVSEAFQVAYVSPPDGSVMEDQPSTILMVFSRRIAPDTVDEDSVRLVSEDGRDVLGERLVSPLTPTTVAFLPRENLERGVRYFMVASTHLRDDAGDSLPARHVSVLALSTPHKATPVGGGGGAPSPNFCGSGDGRTLYFTDVPYAAAAIDTETGDPVDPIAIGAPSHRLHGLACERWFLHWDGADGVTTPNGTKSTSIAATSESGQVVRVLWPNSNRTTDTNEFPVRWAKDDSFFSFISIDFDSGTPLSWIVRIPIRWENGVPVAQPEKEERFARAAPVGPRESPTHIFDWSPSGNLLLYTRGGEMHIHNVVSGTTSNLGHGVFAQFAPVGDDSSVLLAFENVLVNPTESAFGVYTMKADGSGRTQVTTPLHPAYFYWQQPVWSPDGSRLVVKRASRSSKAPSPAFSLRLVDLVAGTVSELRPGKSGILLGWR